MKAAPPPDLSHHDVRMDGVQFYRLRASGAFVKSLEHGNYSYCVMVCSGRLTFETDFPVSKTIALERGDAIAVSGLAQHTFRSANAPQSSTPDLFERAPMSRDGLGADVELVLGVVPNETLALGSLMVGPITVRPAEHPQLSRRLWSTVEMLVDEYADESWIDRNLVIRRLAEIMLLNLSRRVFAERRDMPEGAVARPVSRQLLAAINAFLRAPERAWTLADLAAAAGMSRTRFTDEFKLATGQSPGRVISKMRLTGIARRLVSESLSVDVAADHAGYSSSAAFVRAFQREFGETPARWRKRRRTNTAGARD